MRRWNAQLPFFTSVLFRPSGKHEFGTSGLTHLARVKIIPMFKKQHPVLYWKLNIDVLAGFTERANQPFNIQPATVYTIDTAKQNFSELNKLTKYIYDECDFSLLNAQQKSVVSYALSSYAVFLHFTQKSESTPEIDYFLFSECIKTYENKTDMHKYLDRALALDPNNKQAMDVKSDREYNYSSQEVAERAVFNIHKYCELARVNLHSDNTDCATIDNILSQAIFSADKLLEHFDKGSSFLSEHGKVLSRVYSQYARFFYATHSIENAFPEVEKLIEKALCLDPDNKEAREVQLNMNFNWKKRDLIPLKLRAMYFFWILLFGKYIHNATEKNAIQKTLNKLEELKKTGGVDALTQAILLINETEKQYFYPHGLRHLRDEVTTLYADAKSYQEARQAQKEIEGELFKNPNIVSIGVHVRKDCFGEKTYVIRVGIISTEEYQKQNILNNGQPVIPDKYHLHCKDGSVKDILIEVEETGPVVALGARP